MAVTVLRFFMPVVPKKGCRSLPWDPFEGGIGRYREGSDGRLKRIQRYSESEGEGGWKYPGRYCGLGRPQAGPGSDLPYSRSKTFAMMRNASSKASRIFILPSLDVVVI